MSTSSFKKISAAAVAVVLGFSAVSHGATIYSTGFEGTEVPPYAPGNLQGQNGWTLDGSDNGSTTAAQVVTTGTIDGAQSVLLSTGAGTTAAPVYNDFQNAATGATAVDGLTTNVSMQANLGNSTSGSFAGFSIVNTLTDATVAGFLISQNPTLDAQGNPTGVYHSVESLFNGAAGQYENPPGGSSQNPPVDGATGVYTITLFPAENFYSVTVGGVTLDETLPTGLTGTALSLDLASISAGSSGTATFDDVAVSTPEPASIAMVSLGGLLLLAKRPKKRLV